MQGSYMVPGVNDAWTWDDDYNPRVLAKATQAAREPGPSPRAQLLQQRREAEDSGVPTVITRLPQHLGRDVIRNGVLLLDKPQDWSALDAVRAVKGAVKAAKAGHAGALDEMATGLIIVCLGAATRLAPRFAHLTRTYSGVVRLGATTTTYDATGSVVEEMPWGHITDEDLRRAAGALTGEVTQVPPVWSGAKVAGRPMRWYAERREAAPHRLPRSVLVDSLAVWREELGSRDVSFRLVAGKGCCVRTLAHDLGAALGCGAHLAALRREALGGFSVERAWTLDVLIPMAKKYAKGFRAAPAPAAAAAAAQVAAAQAAAAAAAAAAVAVEGGRPPAQALAGPQGDPGPRSGRLRR